MKKLGYLFLLLFTIMSCSSDDNNTKEVTKRKVETKLQLTASKASIFVGEEVVFTTKNDKGEAVDAEVLIGGATITPTYTFTKAGTYIMRAILKGYEQSNEVTVKVEMSTLSLRISQPKITAGEKVVFEVFNGDKNVTKDVKIYQEGVETALKSNEFTTKKDGDYTFIAKAEGYNDSKPVSLTVLEDPAPYGNFLILNGDKFEIDRFNLELNVITVNGKLVPEVFKTAQGELANQYSLIISNKANDKAKKSYIFIDFWVVNPSIKAGSDGKITDYGTRVLPSTKAKVILRYVYSSIVGYEISDMFSNLNETDFKFRNATFSDVLDKKQYNGKAEIMFNYKSDVKNAKNTGKTLEFQFNADTYLKENVNDK